MASEPPPHSRTLTFAGVSLGEIFIRDWNAPGYGGWQRLAEARGVIAVPAGKEVMLKVNWSASSNLAPLGRLREDDLQWLDFRDTQATDPELSHIRGLRRLHDLGLGHTPVGDPGMAHVGVLTELKELYLAGTRVTDAGVARLGGLTRLEALALNDTAAGDGAAAVLARLTSLRRLWLKNTRLTDAGLEALSALRNLKRIELRGARVTPAGIEKLKRALPGLYVAA